MQALGLPANSDIYMAVMNGLGEKGAWQEAEALFQEMQGLDFQMHELNHAALLGAYGCVPVRFHASALPGAYALALPPSDNGTSH